MLIFLATTVCGYFDGNFWHLVSKRTHLNEFFFDLDITLTFISASVYCVFELMYIIAPRLIHFTFATGYLWVWMWHVGICLPLCCSCSWAIKRKENQSVLLVPVVQNIDFINNISSYHEWFVVLRCWGDSNFSREAQTILSSATSSILLDETEEMRGLNPQLCPGFAFGSPPGRTCPKTPPQADTWGKLSRHLNHLSWLLLKSCGENSTAALTFLGEDKNLEWS